jgi:hypothetical protein
MPPTYSTGEEIKAADWIRGTVRTGGGIWHHGIVWRVFWCRDRYCVEVIHNVKAGGVIISPLEEFADGPVQLVGLPSSPEHAQSILAIAGLNRGKSYSAPFQNCEHFCSFCYTGTATSETVQRLTGMAVVVGIVFGLLGGGSE